ncbi:plasma membrane H+-ATPase Pma1 [Hortaea werneckii]|nr:plasma membrane H+-ATPase Pma1 [Hortaea werneckii]
MPARSQRCLYVPVAGSLFLPEAAPVTNATPGNILVRGEDILILKWEVVVVRKTSEVSGLIGISSAQKFNRLRRSAKRLVIIGIVVGLADQRVLVTAVLILLVLDSQLAEVADDVLHLGVVDVALGTAEVGKAGDNVEEVVGNGDDDGDTNRVGPHHDNGNNVGHTLAVLVVVEATHWVRHRLVSDLLREPTEDTEDSGESVHDSDGSDQGEGRESGATTGDEDEPVLGKGDFEEKNVLDAAVSLDDTTVGQEEGTADDPGSKGKLNTKNDGDDPNLRQLPFDWALLRVSVVVGDSDSSQVSEKGDEDNQLGGDGLVDDDHRGDEVDLQVQAQGDTVLNVCLHTLEDLTSSLDGEDNGGETRSQEDNVGGSLGSLGGTLDGNTTVSLLERWSVVDTVTGHGSQVTTLLQHLDDLVLVLREHLGETIGLLDKVVLSGARKATANQLVRVVDLGTKGKHLASLLGNGNSITSKHLDRDTKLLGLDDSLGSVLTGRVEHRKHTKEDPRLVVLLVSNTERTETTAGELSGLVLEEVGSLLGALGKVENSLGSTLGASEAVATESADRSDTLGDRVERSELLGLPVVLEDVTGLGVTLEGESGACHHPVDVLALSNVRLADGELVGSKSTGLVRAQDVDTSKRLNGGQLLDDSLLLSQVGSADSQSGGCHDRQTDWDTDDEQNQHVVKERVVRVLGGRNVQVTVETTDPCGDNEEHDQDQKRGTDVVHDSLEMTLVLSTLHKGSSATDERVLGGGKDDSVTFATLATSGVVEHVAHELVDSEGLASDGGLVSGNDGQTLVGNTLLIVLALLLLRASWVVLRVESMLFADLLVPGEVLRGVVVADQAAVRWDSLAFLDDNNVTRDQLTGLDILLLTLTDDHCLHGNVTLQTGDDIGGLLFLIPTDESVQEQNTDNDTKVDPVTKTGREQDSEFHDCAKSSKTQFARRNMLEIPADRTSEETQELEEQVLLLSDNFVPAELLAALLNLLVGDTLLDVGLEPFLRNGHVLGTSSVLLPELWISALGSFIQWQLVEADGNCKVAERKLLRCVPCLGLNRTGRPRRRFPYLCLKS